MSLTRRIYVRLYEKIGKDAEVDADVPASVLAGSLARRAVWMTRGLFRFRQPAFIGPNVRVRGRRGLHLGSSCTIEAGCRIDAVARDGVWLGARSKVGANSVISTTSHISRLGAGLRLGRDSSCGEWCYFGASGGITVGNDVIMGQFVSFHAQEHEFGDRHNPIRRQGVRETGIEIGDDTWIGAKATFLDGARVGSGTVVAAGALVRGAHPPSVVLAGVPARVVRSI